MIKPTAQRMVLALGTAFTFVWGAGACSHAVKPDSMSAEEHRDQANADTAQAQKELARAEAEAPAPPNPNISPNNPQGYNYPVDAYNPVDDHLVRARQLEEHARQHREAAVKLEAFAQDECKGFPPETRAACPLLGPVEHIQDLPNGVRVTFSPRTRVDAVAAHMRCHFAYAQAYGFDTVLSCPLYVKGLQISVSKDGKSVELTSRQPKVVDIIRTRTREEAVLVRK